MKQFANAVITVGDGRGFVVETAANGRYVLTAAHCLPSLPPATNLQGDEERTFESILGLLGEEPSISALCLFADPIADVAVLELPEDLEELEAFSLDMDVSRMPDQELPGWVLMLEGNWQACRYQRCGMLWLSGVVVTPGMSGSPILSEEGPAVGVVTSAACAGYDPAGPNPHLVRYLPGWLLLEMATQFAELQEFTETLSVAIVSSATV